MKAFSESAIPAVSVLQHFPSGATATAVPERYDLLPVKGLRRAAIAMGRGAVVHGENNWREGIPIEVCINHAIKHVFDYQRGDTSEDHIANAICRLLMIAELEA